MINFEAFHWIFSSSTNPEIWKNNTFFCYYKKILRLIICPQLTLSISADMVIILIDIEIHQNFVFFIAGMTIEIE